MKAAKEHKLYWSESALVSYDSTTRMASILYTCGAFYIGEVDKGLKREGVGLFFLPFCGFLCGRFSADRAEGNCLLKEGDGTCGVYTFSAGVQHGPALRWNSATGESQQEVYVSGVFHHALFAGRMQNIDEPCDQLAEVLDEAAAFRAKLDDSPLFRVVKTEKFFALGPLRAGSFTGSVFASAPVIVWSAESSLKGVCAAPANVWAKGRSAFLPFWLMLSAMPRS